jgi:N-dimethylarginine dimethylaminohydrolase
VSVQLEAEGPTFWAMRLKKAVNHLMTELNIVAGALILGGVAAQTDLEEQWASYDGQISVPFELTMEKAQA